MRSSRQRRYPVGASPEGRRVEDVVVTGFLVAGVRPPVREALPRRRDRRHHEDEEVDGNADARERRRETGERVAHDHDSAAVADRLDDGVGVLLPTGRLVLAWEVDGDRVMPVRAQRGRNQGPIPRASTAPVDERERRHRGHAIGGTTGKYKLSR
jgi:hypothetical protein